MKLEKVLFMLCMALSPSLLFADSQESGVEIQLMEVLCCDVSLEDSPLGNPYQASDIPPRPTNFRATITDNLLNVTSEAEPVSTLIVRRASDNMVVSQQQFSTDVSAILPAGAYTLEINCSNLTLIGIFNTQN